jgi:hypothetical protein
MRMRYAIHCQKVMWFKMCDFCSYVGPCGLYAGPCSLYVDQCGQYVDLCGLYADPCGLQCYS